MKLKAALTLALSCAILAFVPVAWADKAAAIDEMEAYLEFVDYGGGVIFAQQIPKEDWRKFVIIDARDAAQFAKSHIPGAINMDWRHVLAKRDSIPKDKPVLIYCNTGSLSVQAGLRCVWPVGTICASSRAEWRIGRPRAGLMRRQGLRLLQLTKINFAKAHATAY